MLNVRATSAVIFATFLLAGCSSPEGQASETRADTPEDDQRAAVEAAVREAYEDENTEVTEIAMERSEDGSEYRGPATVRDRETGQELQVNCRVSADARGAPQLSCDRVQGEDAESP